MGGVTFINILIAVVLVVTGFAGYHHKGVVRDVPELDIRVDGEGASLEPQAYNSRISAYDLNFPHNGKKNVLVVGDSFGRDWINVMLESHADTAVNISYHTNVDDAIWQRIDDADLVFIATSHSIFETYDNILPRIADKRYFIVGYKYYGATMGNAYNNNRYGHQYYNYRHPISKRTENREKEEKRLFGNHYIALMSIITDRQHTIPAFTPDHRLISHDGVHFTKAGAQWYAKLIDVSQYLKFQ